MPRPLMHTLPCSGLDVFRQALRFEDRPDYAYLRRLFKELFSKEGYENDGIFDWSQPAMTESVSTDHFQKQAAAYIYI